MIMLEEERRRRRTESGDAGTARPVVRTSYIRNLPKNLGNARSVYLERTGYTGERSFGSMRTDAGKAGKSCYILLMLLNLNQPHRRRCR